MTTETIVQIFSGVALVGVIISLLKSEDDDHDGDGPDKGIMSPVYQGI